MRLLIAIMLVMIFLEGYQLYLENQITIDISNLGEIYNPSCTLYVDTTYFEAYDLTAEYARTMLWWWWHPEARQCGFLFYAQEYLPIAIKDELSIIKEK